MIEMAILVVAIHAAWLLVVILGALWTRGRPFWSGAHILALIWGIIVETGPWPCPLTLAETYFEARAGLAASRSSALLQGLNNIVYPDLPGWVLGAAGAAVCLLNLGIYSRRFLRARLQPQKTV